MKSFVLIGMILAMAATAGVLIVGIVQMFRGGDPRQANRLMQWRIKLQFVAILFFALFMLISRS